MKLSHRIKPISYLKSHTAEIARTIGEQDGPLYITQNGEAKLVVQDVDSYEQTLETLALLKILALGNRQIDEDKVTSVSEGMARIRERKQDS